MIKRPGKVRIRESLNRIEWDKHGVMHDPLAYADDNTSEIDSARKAGSPLTKTEKELPR